jgi:hypothetical protein
MSNQSVSVFIEDVCTDNERSIQTGIGLVSASDEMKFKKSLMIPQG